jgi:starch synthase (maltosyl-transferring)
MPPAPTAAMPDARGRERVVLEDVRPCVDGGRFPAKRVTGERVDVVAHAFTDGHDLVACSVFHRPHGEPGWHEVELVPRGNDVFGGTFRAGPVGRHEYTVRAWIDRFGSWQRDLQKRVDAGQDVAVDLEIGIRLVRDAVEQTEGPDRRALESVLEDLADPAEAIDTALSPSLAELMRRVAPRDDAAELETPLALSVDRARARFSTWYELFPRSAADDASRHGTFADVEKRLPYIASMGFDVLYLPPIHPIGRDHRKGRNNDPQAQPGDVGSPWAIGSAEGGHTSVHPQLGTLEDLDRLVQRAAGHGLEIALDIAFQCAPDHPWVQEHPEWFRHRPDGTIQYAENPPKRYQDIYPLDFESEQWPALWAALRDVVRFWCARGIRIFRVDNPHTKPLPFWDWMIGAIREEYPETIFLAEAFTRPKVMSRLAKAGFTQSYTYFTWRTTAWELREYVTQLTTGPEREFFRPNFWPNTPDILPEHLQWGNRPTFVSRLVLAATLSSNYGIYGPAFELCEGRAVRPGSEEYLDSEKYQLRSWNLDDENSLRSLIARVNAARRENPALQQTNDVRFLETGNENLLAYAKRDDDGDDVVICVVSLDGEHAQSGWLELPLDELGIDGDRPYQVHDLLGGGRYMWQGGRNFVELDPWVVPAHILRVRRHVRTERDFDYFQ